MISVREESTKRKREEAGEKDNRAMRGERKEGTVRQETQRQNGSQNSGLYQDRAEA